MARVPAYTLRPGAIITSGETVITAPTAGLRTPSGKVELVIMNERGHMRRVMWNKHTLIGIRHAAH